MKKENKYFYEMDSLRLNVLSYIIMIFLVLLSYVIIKTMNINFSISDFEYACTLLLLIPYFIFHEILHSIGYVVNGANFKNITYGIHLEKGILCCSCKQVIDKKTVLWSLIYPFIFIGVITYIIALIINSPILLILSIANISGCAGDLIMFFEFLKIKDFKFFEYDNPLAFGIVTTEDFSNKKMFALNKINEENFAQTIDKKVSVSKTSIIIILVYVIFCILNMFI